jgi:hypothetical protein
VAGAELLQALRGGFSARTLRTLSDRCVASDARTVYPGPLLVLEYVTRILAERLEGGPVGVPEFEHVRAMFEPSVQGLIEAMISNDAGAVTQASDRLARIFVQFRA